MTFDHYEVLQRDDGALWELGRGAMGTTYKAFDTNLHCLVALKVINAAYLQSEVARQRFIREARSAAKLRHHNVASVFHLGIEGDDYFYAMEFIDGETVESLIKRAGPLDPILALKIASQVARALSAAERLQLVHRDIKPANLMLVEQDDELVVKVIDFGLAKSSRTEDGGDTAAISMGGFVGTPHFASPEQLEEKDLDVRSDIYSLGATLWYMLAGRAPFSGTLAQVMSQHLQRPPPFDRYGAWPPVVIAVLQRMLEKDPAARPQSAAALRAELDRAVEALKAGGGTEFPTVVDASPLQVGTVVAGRYRILADLGEVNLGRVFHADRDGVEVRLIVLRSDIDPEALAQIRLEVRKLTHIEHPGLLRVLGLESGAGKNLLVLEWTRGFSATDLLRVRRELPVDEALPVLRRLAAGIDHALANGLKRLDLALHRVALHFPGVPEPADRERLVGVSLAQWPEFEAKINPLGLAGDFAASETWAGGQTIVGELSSSSAQGGALPGPAARYLQSLGAIAYELLGGAEQRISTPRYVPLATLSEEGNEVLKRVLDPSRSFASAGDFVRALESAAPSIRRPVPARAGLSASPTPQVAPKRRRVSPVAVVAVGLVALILAAGAGVFLVFRGPSEIPTNKPEASTVAALEQTAPGSLESSPPGVAEETPTPAALEPALDPDERLRQAIGGAEAAETAGDWRKAIQISLRITDDFPESDAGKAHLDELLTRLRSPGEKPSGARFEEIRDLLEQAGHRGSIPAMTLLADNLRKREPEAAFGWTSAAADRGDVSSATQLGLMYSHGAGVAPDLKKAVSWFEEGMRRGDSLALTCLAECYLGGKGVPKDESKAIQLLRDAVAAGDLRAMNLLGNCLRNGTGTAKDFGEALRLFERAQEGGYADALGNLAVLYMNGEGVEPDPVRAVGYFEHGAMEGSAFCMFQFARCLEAGIGTAQDNLAAERWFRKAAEQGEPHALNWCRNHRVEVQSPVN